MARKLVCICNLIEQAEIEDMLNKGAESTSHIQQLTRAGTSCGRCLPEIDALVEAHKNKKPKDQQKLKFGF